MARCGWKSGMAVAMLVAVGCSSATTPGSASTAAAPSNSVGATTLDVAEAAVEPVLPVVLTDDTGAEVTIDDVSRIIPVNGDLAEVVWALGLGDNVVATDISATTPPAAAATPKIGYQRALVAETILVYSPTVILADELAGPPEILDQLRDTGIPVVVIDRTRTIDSPTDKVAAIATALGVPQRGDALIASMRTEIGAALADSATAVQQTGRPRVLALYLRGSSVQLTFGKGSGVDVLIDTAGGTDVGTEVGIVDIQPLSEEAVIKARPDIILVTTTGLESVGGIDGLVELGGIGQTPAGQTRRIYAYEDQYLYGFGPRVGSLLGDLVEVFHSTQTATT